MLSYAEKRGLFFWNGIDAAPAVSAGLKWFGKGNCYVTSSPYLALKLYRYSDALARPLLNTLIQNIRLSGASEPINKYPIPVPDGMSYLPYQDAGIRYMAMHLRNGIKGVLLSDEPGLGKSAQSIGVANYMGFDAIKVVCPASLRINWLRELQTWHVYNKGIKIIATGNDEPVPGKSHIVSYELVNTVKDVRSELVIIDEGHLLGNAATKRTKAVLGNNRVNRGLIQHTPGIILTGTPFPNGKPHQGFPALSQCCPEAIDNMGYLDFLNRFCTYIIDPDTREYYITGSKNEDELYIRLRGSGYMTRRLKKDVLTDLPQVWHKLVVLPSTSETASVVLKEGDFTESEFKPHGISQGEVSPELRREMGEALTPQCIQYASDMLDSGTRKILIGVYHKSVAAMMVQGLEKYGVVSITGNTPMHKRQPYVDQFQTDPDTRVFVGNMQAAGVGYNLTESHDVMIVEPSYVPGENTQFIDRANRIGQKYNVTAHLMVAENSLGARILASAARKLNNASLMQDDKGL